jgi:predicted RNase H-like HicB family nuclease
MDKKDLNYYLDLPYNLIVQHVNDEDGERYLSRVLEFDGCHSHGNTRQEALDNLREAMEGYIEVKLEYGDPIPEPVSVEAYSGKFLVRVPKTLHQRLAMEADREGVSLNQYALYKLAQ